jgi:hypothetical protein
LAPWPNNSLSVVLGGVDVCVSEILDKQRSKSLFKDASFLLKYEVLLQYEVSLQYEAAYTNQSL